MKRYTNPRLPTIPLQHPCREIVELAKLVGGWSWKLEICWGKLLLIFRGGGNLSYPETCLDCLQLTTRLLCDL